MPKVNMLEAKTNLSKLVEAVESGRETEIILARNGKPVARIVPIEQPEVDTSKRVGIAEGQFGDFDFDEFQALDEVVWRDWNDKVLGPSADEAFMPKKKKKTAA